jgi:hypothetical protein
VVKASDGPDEGYGQRGQFLSTRQDLVSLCLIYHSVDTDLRLRETLSAFCMAPSASE